MYVSVIHYDFSEHLKFYNKLSYYLMNNFVAV